MKYLAKCNHYSFAETEGWHELVKKNVLTEAVATFKPSGTQGTKGLFLAHARQASLGARMVGNTPANAGDVGMSPGWGRSPEEGNGNPLQSSCLQNPMWTEEPGRLQSTGSQRVGHEWATNTFTLDGHHGSSEAPFGSSSPSGPTSIWGAGNFYPSNRPYRCQLTRAVSSSTQGHYVWRPWIEPQVFRNHHSAGCITINAHTQNHVPISSNALNQLHQSDLCVNKQDPHTVSFTPQVPRVSVLAHGFDAWVEFTQCSPVLTVRPIKITSSINDLRIQLLLHHSLTRAAMYGGSGCALNKERKQCFLWWHVHVTPGVVQ